MRVGLATMLLWGCGGAAEAPVEPPPGSRVLASLEATPTGPEDVIVARVDGRPVWGSCVAAQAARDHLTAQAARQRCIDFELLAIEAERRGLATAPDVVEGARQGLVNRFVETQFEQVFATPASMAKQMAPTLDRLMRRPDQPELRGSSFVRVTLAKDATPAQEREAKAVMDTIYAELGKIGVGGGRGLFPRDLAQAAARHRKDTSLPFEQADFHLEAITRLVDKYGDALFAIGEVGEISPVTRTEFGWEIILMTEKKEAHRFTREEIAADLFPQARLQYFNRWADGLGAGMDVVKHYDALELMLVDGATAEPGPPRPAPRPGP